MDFFFVNNKPDEQVGIEELKSKIAEVAYHLPGMGRKVPEKWQTFREELSNQEQGYLPYENVIAICENAGVEIEQAQMFLKISHILGHLIHYETDPTLRDIVILKPDWLAKAISFVLDDKTTRNSKGLIEFTRLSNLWRNPPKDEKGNPQKGYPENLHPIFLRLMERFDLCYPIKKENQETNEILIAQLVTEQISPFPPAWSQPKAEQSEKVQFCRFFATVGGRPEEPPEGLIYRLIVRFYRYSLGQDNYADSVHWQKGLMLKDKEDTNYALIEQIEDGIKITVRGFYPDALLHPIIGDIQYLIETFWAGICCEFFFYLVLILVV